MGKKIEKNLTKISQGVLLSICILAVMFAMNKDSIIAEICLYETLPGYKIENSMKTLFKLSPDSLQENGLVSSDGDTEAVAVYSQQDGAVTATPENTPLIIDKVEDTDIQIDGGGLIGLDDIIFQPETDYSDLFNHFQKENFTIDDVASLRDLSNLKRAFYVVDKRTDITSDLFSVDEFLSADLKIDNNSEGPKVLIFHTHTTEMYADSAMNEKNQGVIGVGNLLCEILENRYGIETIHNTDSFDIVDGKSHIMGAYERMEPVIKKILTDNPSIQVAIDIHRDGVVETTRLVENINGKKTAQIMFVNGLSKLYKDGQLQNLASLPNPNIKLNLAFSFNMQLAANSLYPGLTRKVYLNAYRYSMHMLPKSLLVEIGAQTNTEEEARNAAEPLAEVLANVILKQ